MTVIGELAVNAVVRTEGVSKGTKTFSREMEEAVKFTAGWDTALRTVEGTLVGLAATAVHIAVAQTHVAQATSRVTEKLELSVEQLSRYRYAANAAADMTDDQLDGAIERMSVNVDAAAHGLGKAGKALAELGLDAKFLAGLDTDRQMAMLADALARVDKTSRIRLSERIFGDGNIALMMQRGADGLAELGRESDAAGATLGTLANQKLDDAGNAIDKMRKSVAGAAHELGGLLAPAIAEVADFVGTSAAGFKKFAPAMTEAELTAKFLGERLERERAIVARVNTEWERRARVIGQARGAAIQAASDKNYEEDVRDRGALQSQIDAARRGNETFGKSDLEVARLDRAEHMVDRGMNDALIRELEIREKLEDEKKKAAEAQDRENKLNERAASIIEDNLTPLEELQTKLREINALHAAGKLTNDQAIRAAQAAQSGFAGDVGEATATARAPLAAVGFGTSEAQRAIAESRNQNKDKIPEKQLAKLEEGNKLTQELIAAVKENHAFAETATWP